MFQLQFFLAHHDNFDTIMTKLSLRASPMQAYGTGGLKITRWLQNLRHTRS